MRRIMDIITDARRFMYAAGNTSQWSGEYPDSRRIAADIAAGYSYVAINDGVTAATFCLMPSPEPNYASIKGEWLSDEPYHVIHRMACAVRGQGVASACMEWCLTQAPHLRADTHRDNTPMRNLLLKYGFKECGIVHVEDGTERIAYEHHA